MAVSELLVASPRDAAVGARTHAGSAVVEQLLDELDVREQHAPAAVALEVK